MDLATWGAFVAASLVVLAIPGPTVVLVTSYAAARGRAVALRMAAGVGLGDLVAMVAALGGLGALLAASATAFTILKLVGAGYLVWLGIGLLRGTMASGEGPPPLPARDPFWHAAAVTALNPKSIAFFVAFVPQFLDPAAPVGPQAALAVSTFVSLAMLNAAGWAWLAAGMPGQARASLPRRLQGAGGAGLIAMGLAAALSRRAPA